MHGPPAAYCVAAMPQNEDRAAECPALLLAGNPLPDAALALLQRACDMEREVMTLRGLLAAETTDTGDGGDSGRAQHLKEEIVRLLSKVIVFRAGLARE